MTNNKLSTPSIIRASWWNLPRPYAKPSWWYIIQDSLAYARCFVIAYVLPTFMLIHICIAACIAAYCFVPFCFYASLSWHKSKRICIFGYQWYIWYISAMWWQSLRFLACSDTYIQIHMIDFVLAVEQRIEEDVISCLKNGTHTKSGDDNKMLTIVSIWYKRESWLVSFSANNCCHCHTIIILLSSLQ